MPLRHIMMSTALILACALIARAGTVTIDTNGFPNIMGGQVYGPGLKEAIKIARGEQKITLNGLQANGEYSVDFFHNSGEGSSDFAFTMNAAGAGVESVSKGGGVHTMVVGFKPGDSTLKLNTHELRFNTRLGQSSSYYIHGLNEAQVKAHGTGALVVKVVPGVYQVDNLYNSGAGNEDWQFIVDSYGKAGPRPDAKGLEFAEFKDNEVNPRSVVLHFVIEGSEPVNFHADQGITAPVRNEKTFEVDMQATPGNCGINVWSFGSSFVIQSDVLLPDEKSQIGEKGKNDFFFRPRLRYDVARKEWYFDTPSGKLPITRAQATGMFDGEEKPLTVRCSASIVPGKATTRPAE